jgi:hypothetical protein
VRIRAYVENQNESDDADLVRCLDCGTVYRQPRPNTESRPCPSCGYVGWIAVSVEQREQETTG